MKLARIELIIIPIFIFCKAIRPSVLRSEVPHFVKITLPSLPNFFEAIIGTITLTGVGLLLNNLLPKKYQATPRLVYIIAVVVAGIYVIFQELNIISIRTNGTTDQNDLIFSIIGLIVGYWMVISVKPRIISSTEENS